jgi:hypothetical protein
MKTPTLTKKTILKLTLSLVFIAIAVCLVWYLTWSSTTNYAAEVAKPLEQRLVEAGAVKKCSYGDAGRGPSNWEPWYRSYFEVPTPREQAIELLDEISAKEGFNLTHATPENRGHLGAVGDIHIQNWFFDNTSKKANFPRLEEGFVKLAFSVNNDEAYEVSGLSCGSGKEKPVTINAGTERTGVSISIELPDIKR